MEYNTTRPKLQLPEYGRTIQSMVEHLLTIEDKEKRLQQANVVIDIMGILNPQLKNTEDFRHKLWDHIHQIAHFQLDVDGPFEAPTEEQLSAKPDPLPYPQSKGVKIRHFGKNLDALIQKAIAEEDPQKRQGYTQIIGYYMKLAYTNWHREPVHDEMIRNELNEISGGVLQYEPGGYKVFFDTRQQANPNFGKNRNNRNYKGNNNSGGQNRNFKNKNYSKNRNFKNSNNK